jgi:hypothetical protein
MELFVYKSITSLFLVGFYLTASIPHSVEASQLNESNATESVGFYIRNLDICHQDEWRHMSVRFEYDGDIKDGEVSAYQVKDYVKNFLKSYANPMDFWEIMNTNLVSSILQAFPNIRTLKSEIALSPDQALPFPRQSTVKYDSHAKAFKESFNFTKIDYLICSQTFESLDMHVDFDIKENPDMFDYPDYQWIDQAMEEFFKETPVSFSTWSTIKPKLESILLERFPTLTAINIEVTLAK